jgi:hypothetical protein
MGDRQGSIPHRILRMSEGPNEGPDSRENLEMATQICAALGITQVSIEIVDSGFARWEGINGEGFSSGLIAYTETFRAGVTVKLYREGICYEDFDVDTTGEAGLWATWWCQGSLI